MAEAAKEVGREKWDLEESPVKNFGSHELLSSADESPGPVVMPITDFLLHKTHK